VLKGALSTINQPIIYYLFLQYLTDYITKQPVLVDCRSVKPRQLLKVVEGGIQYFIIFFFIFSHKRLSARMIYIWLVLKVYVLYYITICSSKVQHAVGLRKEHVDHIDIDNWKISESDSISLVEYIILCYYILSSNKGIFV